MKKIFLKQYNALFDYPIVKEPIASDFSFFGPYDKYEFDGASYQDALEQRKTWLQSKIEIVGEHSFEDNQVVVEGVDYKKVWYNHGGFDKPDNYGWAIIPIN